MRIKKLIMMIALLCATAQGAWADTWDGKTYTKPEYYKKDLGFWNVIEIHSAAELAYIQSNFANNTGYSHSGAPSHFYEANYLLDEDIDMGDGVSWNSLGNDNSAPTAYKGTFYGNGHTIRLHTSGATENYQGLFARIDGGGKVQDLHISGSIHCSSSRLVGGITGENYGTIENCWVSADVSSDWKESGSSYKAKVGGITGENHGTIQYCCVSGNVTNNDAYVGGLVGYNNGGTIDNCTFYGTRNSTHSQNSICVGEQSGGTVTNVHDSFTYDEMANYLSNIENKYTLYRDALQYPFSDTPIFDANWVDADKRADKFSTVDGNTVTIKTEAELGLLAYLSNSTDGKYGGGMTFLLGDNLDMSACQWIPISGKENNAFNGTFDGQGHTISGINVRVGSESYAGLFGHLGSGTVQNLKLVNSSITETTESCAAGGIAGEVINGKIKNCYVGSDVTVTATENCGGIAGRMTDSQALIEGCYSAATVKGRSSIGGILGKRISESGNVVRNVSQAQLTGENMSGYAYIIGNDEADRSRCQTLSNFYIDRTHINDTDTPAYHVTLDAALKEYGYGMAYKASEHEYSCSGLKFVTVDQFLMNGEGYVAKDKTFYFNPTNDLAGAVLGNVTAGGTPVAKNSDGYYYFTTAADVEVSGTMELRLPNNGNNNSLLNKFKDHTMNVTLADRTLYRDGSWNTLYLPFRLSEEELAADDCPLKGATIKSLSSSSFGEGTLTLKFSDAQTRIVDGVPYIVKWATTGEDIKNPVFKNVTIKNAPGQTTTTNVYFKGSFSPVKLNANDKSVLFLGAGNKLYYPTADVTVGACSAYFQLRDITAGDLNAGVRSIVMDFGDENLTGINEVIEVNSNSWYTLDGRRLSGKPTSVGLYINNGKKVIVK